VDLQALISAGVRSVRTIAEERGIVLDSDFTPRSADAVCVVGDASLLRRLLLNLVDNALKHTPPGGRISVTLESTPAQASIIVSDSGPGVPVALRPHVFDRFVRQPLTVSSPIESDVKATAVPTASGAGLGLAIAQTIAEAHGGGIALDDRDEGASFRVTLPRAT